MAPLVRTGGSRHTGLAAPPHRNIHSQCALNALAIDELLEYAKLYLDGTMQIWVDAEDSIEL